MAHKSAKMVGESTNVENVILYIDNSNIFEESRKHSAKLKGYMEGMIDVTCRIDVGKLISKAVGDRQLLTGKLYGSVPPALDTGNCTPFSVLIRLVLCLAWFRVNTLIHICRMQYTDNAECNKHTEY